MEQKKRRIAYLKAEQAAINTEFWKLVEENRERLKELRSLRYTNRDTWEGFTKAKAQAPELPEMDGAGIKNNKSHRR